MNKLLTSILALALAVVSASAQTAVTVTRADGTILNTAPLLDGTALACYGGYGSCQVDKDLLAGLGDGGFEPWQATSIWVQDTAGTGAGTSGSPATNSWFVGLHDQFYIQPGETAGGLSSTWVGGTDTIIQSPTAGLVGCSDKISTIGTFFRATMSTTAGSTTATVVPYQVGWAPGQVLTGSSLATGTVVSVGTYGASTITISPAATATATNIQITGSPSDGIDGQLVFTSTPGVNGATGTCGSTPVGTLHQTQSKLMTPANGSTLNVSGVNIYAQNGATVTADTATPLDGLVSARLNSLASGSYGFIKFVYDSELDDVFVAMDGTYTISALVRLNSGTANFTMTLVRSVGGVNCTSPSLPLTSTATVVSWTCTATEKTSKPAPNPIGLTVNMNSNDFDIDDVSITKTSGQDAANTSVFRDEYVHTLQNKFFQGGRGLLRLGPEFQNGDTFDNWTNPKFSRHQTTYSPHGGFMPHPTLPDFLTLAKVVGADPYFHLPSTLTQAEAVSYAKFLCSTNASDAEVIKRTTVWSHPAPYCGPGGDFPQMFVTYGNELWNYADAFIGGDIPLIDSDTSQYVRANLRASTIFAAMRGTSAYQPNYVTLIVNEQEANSSGLATEMAKMPATGGAADGVETAAYMGVPFTSAATNESEWRIGISTPYAWVNNPSASLYQDVTGVEGMTYCGTSGTANCKMFMYEQGPGDLTSCGDSTHPACQAASSAVTDAISLQALDVGAGQAIISADRFMENLTRGVVGQNEFASNQFGIGGPQINASTGIKDEAYVWGSAVDYGGAEAALDSADARLRPSALGIQVANYAVIGSQTSCTNNAGSYSQPAGPDTTIVPATTVPTLSTKCFMDGAGHFSIFLLNRSTSQSFAVSLAGTNPTLGTMTGLQFAPSNLNTVNEATAINPSYANPALAAQTNAAPLNLANTVLSGTNLSTVTIPPNSVTAIRYQLSATSSPKVIFMNIGGQVKALVQ